MAFSTQQKIEDTEVLLKRALLSTTLSCFGVDGNGQYGQCFFAKSFQVSDVELVPNGDTFVRAFITLDGYDSTIQGHVATDHNLKLSIDAKLQNHFINTSSWDFSALQFQQSDGFAIDIELNKFLY